MATSRKPRTKTTRSQSRARTFAPIPLTGITRAEEELALKFDELVTSNKVTDRQIKALQPDIILAKVRGGSVSAGKQLSDFGRVVGLAWPDSLYVPRDQQATSRPKVPENRLYSHEWTRGNGVGTASRDTGGLFAYGAASTIDRQE